MFTLALLGPVTLRRGGVLLALPTHKVQALLLLLALGGPAHRSRLASWLWPQLDDSSARRNLRRELARLRDAGAGDALQADAEVLALAATVQCDARAFVAALAAGRHDEALALWRGPPADGLQLDNAEGFDDWLASERQRLLAQHRQALEAAAVASEARGEIEIALAHMQALLADDPLQEQRHRDAMRLHALAGRREAALAQYTRCRDLLAQELGLAPAAATEELAAQLRGAPPVPHAHAPRADPVPGTAGWSGDMPLVGRGAAWAQLHDAWAAGHTLLIEGEAGIGKTRLAREFAASRGAYALAQCRRSDTAVPYAAFTRALRQLAGDTLARAGLPTWVRDELARLLPELGTAPTRMASPADQRRFFEACQSAWQALSADSFDAIVIDDWHLADDASRALFGFIAAQRAEVAGSAAREIFVLRPELDDGALAALRSLLDGGRATQVTLAPLSSAELLELVRRLSGADDPQRFAQRLERGTGGNPFFVAETLRQWLGLQLLSAGPGGVWRTPFDDATRDYGELPVPDSVRDTVLARVQRVPDAARRLLEAAALASEPFTPRLLAGACALSEVEALAGIEQAVAAQLLRERDGGYAFAHDLVQMALDSALAPERRRLVHRRLALGAEAAALPPADIAQHWEAGGEPQRAVAHRIAAAEAARALFSDAAAQAHWQAALADGPTPAQRLRILRERWGLQRSHEDSAGVAATLRELDALHAQAAGDPAQLLVALDAAIEAAHVCSMTGASAEALARIDACLGVPLPGVARNANALLVRSQALNGVGRSDEGAAAAEQALAGGGLLPQQQGSLLHSLAYSCFQRGQPQPALAYARRTLALWLSTGSLRQAARARANIGLMLSALGDQQAAAAEMQQALALAAEMNIVDLQRELANNLAYIHLHDGEPARAIALIEQAWQLSPQFSAPDKPVYFLGMLVAAFAQCGELGRALGHAEDAFARALALGEGDALADCVSMSLDVYSWIGDAGTAARLIERTQALSLEGIAHLRVKLAFNLVFHALRFGDVVAARRHLDSVGDVQALGELQDQVNTAWCHAEVLLAEGRPQQALGWLDAWEGRARHADAGTLMAAARLQAWCALGVRQEGLLAQALLRLASPQTPALPALALRRACLYHAAPAQRQVLQAEYTAALQRLAASLDPRPRERALLLARMA